jgi:hypothetical protein
VSQREAGFSKHGQALLDSDPQLSVSVLVVLRGIQLPPALRKRRAQPDQTLDVSDQRVDLGRGGQGSRSIGLRAAVLLNERVDHLQERSLLRGGQGLDPREAAHEPAVSQPLDLAAVVILAEDAVGGHLQRSAELEDLLKRDATAAYLDLRQRRLMAADQLGQLDLAEPSLQSQRA